MCQLSRRTRNSRRIERKIPRRKPFPHEYFYFYIYCMAHGKIVFPSHFGDRRTSVQAYEVQIDKTLKNCWIHYWLFVGIRVLSFILRTQKNNNKKTPFLGSSLPVFVVKLKQGGDAFWLLFTIDLCSAIIQNVSARAFNWLAKHTSMLKD